MQYSIKIDCEEISQFLQEFCFSHGITWDNVDNKIAFQFLDKPYLIINLTSRFIYWHTDAKSNQEISLSEIIAIIKALPEFPKIKLGSYDVLFNQDKSGIKVGCTSVTKDQVKQIWEALQ